MSRALRLRALLEPLNLLPSTRSGLDLDLLPELSEVFRKSDEVFYGSWQPRLSPIWRERHFNFEPDRWYRWNTGVYTNAAVAKVAQSLSHSEEFKKFPVELSSTEPRSHLHVERRQRYEEHVKSTVPPSQLLIFDASKGDTLGKLASFLNVSVPNEVPLDNFPKLFDGNSVSWLMLSGLDFRWFCHERDDSMALFFCCHILGAPKQGIKPGHTSMHSCTQCGLAYCNGACFRRGLPRFPWAAERHCELDK